MECLNLLHSIGDLYLTFTSPLVSQNYLPFLMPFLFKDSYDSQNVYKVEINFFELVYCFIIKHFMNCKNSQIKNFKYRHNIKVQANSQTH